MQHRLAAGAAVATLVACTLLVMMYFGMGPAGLADAAERPHGDMTGRRRLQINAREYEFEQHFRKYPHMWRHLGPAAAEDQVVLHFSLRPRNMEKIYELAEAISTPGSAQYGAHMSGEEVAKVVAPPAEEVARVTSFLQQNQITHDVLTTKHVIRAVAPAAAWRDALGVELHRFQSQVHGRQVVRKLGAHWLPEDVHEVVQHIAGLADVPPKHRKGVVAGTTRRAATHGNRKVGGDIQWVDGATVESHCVNYPKGFGLFTASWPTPASAFQFAGYFTCADGVAQPNKDMCTPSVVNVTATVTFMNGLMTTMASSPAAYVSNPSSWLSYGGYAVALFQTNVQVPVGMAVHTEVTATFSDNQRITTRCNVYAVHAPSSPQAMASHYNLPLGASNPNSNTTMGVYSQGEGYDEADLDLYTETMGIPRQHVAADVLVNGAEPDAVGEEATLDVQTMIGVNGAAGSMYWNFANADGSMDVLTAELLHDLKRTPMVVSISYGWDESSDDPSQRTAAENLAMLATTDKTLIAASGDNGAMGNGCNTDMCSQCCNPQHYAPEFPATNPFVVAVGATIITPVGWSPLHLQGSDRVGVLGWPSPSLVSLDGRSGEIVCTVQAGASITTGGGYSKSFKAPSYQKAALERYLKYPKSSSSAWPPRNAAHNLMRGYPDIAMSGHNFPIALNGKLQSLDGTSASTPVFASVVSLLNGARVAAGKPPMGHILPFLYDLAYKHPEVFNDVVVGDMSLAQPVNVGNCTAVQNCSAQALAAAPGWDAATGWGSIKYDLLLQYALAAGPATMNLSTDEARTALLVGSIVGGAGTLLSLCAICILFCFRRSTNQKLYGQVSPTPTPTSP